MQFSGYISPQLLYLVSSANFCTERHGSAGRELWSPQRPVEFLERLVKFPERVVELKKRVVE